MTRFFRSQILTVTSVLTMAATSWAQDPPPAQPIGAGQPSEALPVPQSDNDPKPPVPSPVVPMSGITEQAGVGGTQAYGRAGVLELGGSAGFRAAENITQFNFDPSVGMFIVDNVQLSAILGIAYAKVGENDTTLFRILIEPSFHLPFTQTLFGFVGVGVGYSHTPKQDVGGETFGGGGLAIAPRLGINVLIGRSGILTPSFNVDYSTKSIITTPQGQALVGVSAAYGINIGYTVMW